MLAGDLEDPLAGSKQVLGVIPPPPHDCIFMLQRLGIALTHVSDFDTNGYMHWKGTQGGTQAYQNPQKIGAVRTDASSKSGGYAAHSFVQGKEWDGKPNSTNSGPNQWLSVAMRNGDAFEVNHYCLRHGSSYGWRRLRSWELQGREGDSAGWVTLRKHTNDEVLADEGFATAGWAVEGGKGSFSQFRVLQTGPNSSGLNYLCCAGLELYGMLLPGGS